MRTKRIIGKNHHEKKFSFALSFMKKFILLIVSLAYLATSSGATIYIHECMGKRLQWDLKADESDKCAKCGMHKNERNDCCKDHVKVLKVQNDQQLPENFFKNIFSADAALPAAFYILPKQNFFSPRNKINHYKYPPSGSKTSYCILYCTFLI